MEFEHMTSAEKQKNTGEGRSYHTTNWMLLPVRCFLRVILNFYAFSSPCISSKAQHCKKDVPRPTSGQVEEDGVTALCSKFLIIA